MTVRLRKALLMLAEDNPDDVEITRRAMKKVQFACDLIITRDGQEALERLIAIDEPIPDLVLMDINLPKLNGLQVLCEVRHTSRLAGLPIIMMSASARQEDVQESYRLGANTYIQKPVVFENFLTTLEVVSRYWFEIARLQRPL